MQKVANILDFPHPGLDPMVWTAEEKLRPEFRELILSTIYSLLDKADFKHYKEWIKLIKIVGSITTYQYISSSDIDAHIVVDLDKFVKLEKPEMTDQEAHDFLDQLRKTWKGGSSENPMEIGTFILPGTAHPVEIYFETRLTKNVYAQPGTYNLLDDKWDSEPKGVSQDFDIEEMKPYLIDLAVTEAKELDVKFGEIKRQIQRIEELQEVIQAWPEDQRKLFRDKLNERVKIVESEIKDILALKQDLVEKRRSDYSPDSEDEIKFKYLQKFGYLWILSQIEDIFEKTDSIQEVNIPEVKDVMVEASLKKESFLKRMDLADFYLLTLLPKQYYEFYPEVQALMETVVFQLKDEYIREGLRVLMKELYYLDKDMDYDGITKPKNESQIPQQIRRFYQKGPKNWSLKLSTVKSFEDYATLFRYGQFTESYGGKAWATIAEGLERLQKAGSVSQIIVAIDYINDLSHNNDYIMTKLFKEAPWISEFLDAKYEDGAFDYLRPLASSDVKKVLNEYLNVAQPKDDEGLEQVPASKKFRLLKQSALYKEAVQKQDVVDFYLLSLVPEDYLGDEGKALFHTIILALRDEYLDRGMDELRDEAETYEFSEDLSNDDMESSYENVKPYYKYQESDEYWAFARDFNSFSFKDFYIFFTYGPWNENYGGPAWGEIAKTLQQIQQVSDPKALIGLIDHLHDLGHNTGKFLDKFPEWSEWFQRLLDEKATFDSVRRLMPQASSQVQKIIAAYFRLRQEDWRAVRYPEKEFSKPDIRILLEDKNTPYEVLYNMTQFLVRQGHVGDYFGDIDRLIAHPNFPKRGFTVLANFALKDGANWLLEKVLESGKLPKDILLRIALKSDDDIKSQMAQNTKMDSDVLHVLASSRQEYIRQRIAMNPNVKSSTLLVLSQDKDELTRRAVAGNKKAPLQALETLSKDSEPKVVGAVLLNRRTPPDMVMRILPEIKDPYIWRTIAGSEKTAEVVLGYIADNLLKVARFDGTMNALVMAALAGNEKTPSNVLEKLLRYPNLSVWKLIAVNPNVTPKILRRMVRVEWVKKNSDLFGMIKKKLQTRVLTPTSLQPGPIQKLAFDFSGEGKLYIDFDNTIAHLNEDNSIGEPFDGVKEALSKLKKDGWKLTIYSGRANEDKGIDEIKAFMKENDLPYDDIFVGKPIAEYYIDDRALKFTSWKEVLTEIKKPLDKKAFLPHAYWIDPFGKVYEVRGEEDSSYTHDNWINHERELLKTKYGYPIALKEPKAPEYVKQPGTETYHMQPVEQKEMWDSWKIREYMIHEGWVRVGDASGATEGWGITINDIRHIPGYVDDLVAQFYEEGTPITVEDEEGESVEINTTSPSIQKAVNQALMAPRMPAMSKKELKDFILKYASNTIEIGKVRLQWDENTKKTFPVVVPQELLEKYIETVRQFKSLPWDKKNLKQLDVIDRARAKLHDELMEYAFHALFPTMQIEKAPLTAGEIRGKIAEMVEEFVHYTEENKKEAQVEGNGYPYSSTQVNLPEHPAKVISEWSKKIPSEHLFDDETGKYGRIILPHVTVLYGLLTNNIDDVRKLLDGEKPVSIKLGKTKYFAADDKYDVINVVVESPDLARLNEKLRSLDHENPQGDDYKPHVTVAYVKPGYGKLYTDEDFVDGEVFQSSVITFSPKEGRTSGIELKADFMPSDVTQAPNNNWGPDDTVIPVDEEPSDKPTLYSPIEDKPRKGLIDRLLDLFRDTTKESSLDTSDEILKAYKASGGKGATYNLQHGNLDGTPNFAVSIYPELSMILDHPPTKEDLDQYISAHQGLLDDRRSIGVWTDGSQTYLDIVLTVPEKEKALALGKMYNQISIFDLKTHQEISTSGTGKASALKVSKEESGYVDNGKGYSCGRCAYFKDNKCALVQGEIQAQGCCNFWNDKQELKQEGAGYSKEEAGYIEVQGVNYRCDECIFFKNNACSKVEGEISATASCNFWKPMSSKEASLSKKAKPATRYWIAPDGTEYPVHGIHPTWILGEGQKILPKYGINPKQATYEIHDQMKEQGWTRVSTEGPGFQIEVQDMNHLPAYLDDFIAKNFEKGDEILIGDGQRRGVFIRDPFPTIQKAVNKEMHLAVAKLAHLEGKLWLDPSGKEYPVSTFHDGWIRDNMEMLISEYGLPAFNHDYNTWVPMAYNYLIQHGWARVGAGMGPRFMVIEVNDLHNLPSYLDSFLATRYTPGDVVQLSDSQNNMVTVDEIFPRIQSVINRELPKEVKTSEKQTATTWDDPRQDMEPYKPLPTTFEQTTNDENLGQRDYPRRFMGRPKGPGYSNEGEAYSLLFKGYWKFNGKVYKVAIVNDHVLIKEAEGGYSNTYTDAQGEQFYTEQHEYSDNSGGGNVYHDWNSSSTDYPKNPSTYKVRLNLMMNPADREGDPSLDGIPYEVTHYFGMPQQGDS